MLTSARFPYPSFSPGGRQLAVIYARDDNHSELRLLDVVPSPWPGPSSDA